MLALYVGDFDLTIHLQLQKGTLDCTNTRQREENPRNVYRNGHVPCS